MPWQVWLILGCLGAFSALLWWVRQQGKLIQASHDEVAALELADEIKETSREAAEAASDRRDTGLHNVPGVVQPDRYPAWLTEKR